MKINQIISEGFVNAVGFDDKAQSIKEKYKDVVWAMLQRSYAAIGGIKGTGFGSPDEMVAKIPFWKIATQDGKPVAVIMYKDKGGRKSVATGTDGSPAATKYIDDIFRNEITRAYGEKSKAALGKMLKLIPWDILEKYVVDPDRVAAMQPQARVIPLADVRKEDWPPDAALTISKHPYLLHYGYLRDLGGQLTFKIMLGSPGKPIK